jgi:maleylpyruvate isomerase
VRWAFALKGIECEFVHVNLLNGETETPEHLKRNPLGYVPVLQIVEKGQTHFLSESLAIIEWAEELHPTPSLLPGDAYQRARIRQLAEVINAGTQPLQNLNPTHLHSSDPAEQKKWMQHWIRNGLGAYEQLTKDMAGKFSVGDTVTLADLCLIPQCYNAKRNDVALEDYPTVAKIYAAALMTDACQKAAPERFQPQA